MQSEPLRRYALALALIPDADAAGDLFMDAHSEQDLRRRASAWRRTHGLPALSADPPLPPLSEEQCQHALHLLRRSRRRRLLRRALLAGFGVAVLAGVVLALRTPSDPAFAGLPLRQTAGNRFAVFRVESTPSQVTVWWSAVGQGAALTPQLELRALEEHVWITPSATDRRVERGRVLGRSTFQRVEGFVGDEHIRLGGDGADVLSVPPVWRVDESGARVIPVRWQGSGITISTVTVDPHYTLVSVIPARTGGLEARLPALTVEGPSGPLPWRGGIPAQGPGQPYSYVFDPVPSGAHQVLLRPDSPPTSEPVSYELSRTTDSITIVRNDVNVEIVIPTGDPNLGLNEASIIDAEGKNYPATVYVRGTVTQTGTGYEFRVRAENVPPGARLTRVVGILLHRNPITIPVDLP